MSEAIAEMKTIASPDSVIAEPPSLLSEGVRDSVVPEAVYVPLPISQFEVPSSMTYRTESPSETPAAAKVW
jgi:hypothetical protein